MPTSRAARRTRRARSPGSSASSASSLRSNAGHQPPSSATPASRPRTSVAGGEVDLGRPVERLGEAGGAGRHDHEVLDVDAAAGVGAAAEDLDLGQRQRDGLAAAGWRWRHSGCPTTRRGGVGARPSTWRRRRCPRVDDSDGVPSRPTSTASMPAWSSASSPTSAAAIGPLTWSTARRTSSRRSVGPPSRRSTASPRPVDAPAGAMARPLAVAAAHLDLDRRPARESHIRRPRTDVIVVSSLPVHARHVQRRRARPASPAGRRAAAPRRPHPAARRLVEVLDRREAVDAGQSRAATQARRGRRRRGGSHVTRRRRRRRARSAQSRKAPVAGGRRGT